jgi:hypothetical protein
VAEKAIIRTNAVYINNDRYIEKIKAKFPDYAYYESKDAYFGVHDAEVNDEPFEDWIPDGRDLVAF